MPLQLNPGFSLDLIQQIPYEFAKSRPNGGAALWLGTGFGKGFIAPCLMIDWANEGHTRQLIAAPAKLVEDWRIKLKRYANIDVALWDDREDHPWQIISHTLLQEQKRGAKVKRRDRIKEIIDWKPQVFIVDEHHRFKSYSAAQTKGLLRIETWCRPTKRLGMTATPCTTLDPEELRPQLMFIDRRMMQEFEYDQWKMFRKMFCKVEKKYFGENMIEQVVGMRNEKELHRLTSYVALRMERDDMPEGSFNKVFYRMSPTAFRYYCRMANEGAILDKKMEVVTSSGGDKAIRCLQIRSGFVSDFEGNKWDLDDSMIDTCVELAETLPKPLVVVYHFVHTGDRLYQALCKRYKRVARIGGGMNSSEAAFISRRFQAGELDVVIGQETSISLGLDFQLSHNMIFAEPTYSLENWIQLLGRIRRRGQIRPPVYHLLIEPNTVDETAYDFNLAGKADFADLVTRGAIPLIKK